MSDNISNSSWVTKKKKKFLKLIFSNFYTQHRAQTHNKSHIPFQLRQPDAPHKILSSIWEFQGGWLLEEVVLRVQMVILGFFLLVLVSGLVRFLRQTPFMEV